MARLTKKLPKSRADYSFGDLVYWHLFKYGTRPNGMPDAKMGRPWDQPDICELLEISERTLRNWISDKTLPESGSANRLAFELFGDNGVWDVQRAELQAAFEAGWARKGRKAAETTDTSAGVEPDVAAEEVERNSEPKEEPKDVRAEAQESEPPSDDATERKTQSERSFPAPIAVSSHFRFQPRRVSTFVTIIIVLVGALAILQIETSPRSTVPQKSTIAEKKEPDRNVVVPTAPAPKLPVEKKFDAAQKTEQRQRPVEHPKQELPKKELIEEEQRDAERERIIRETVIANIKAEENATAERNKIAKERDDEEQKAARLQRDRLANAQNIAGIGFELRENTSVTGQSIGQVQVATVADCALACLRDNCDGFAYYHDQNVNAYRKTRACYRFRAPLSFSAHPHYTSGLRKSAATKTEQQSEAPAPVQIVQAAPPQNDSSDGVLQCANGPVKVGGFKLSCDRILGGGTTLGSAQLSYTVAHINECASKCRSIQKCVGFTFNAADTPGRHACIIFGPTPEPRQSNGWISGLR